MFYDYYTIEYSTFIFKQAWNAEDVICIVISFKNEKDCSLRTGIELRLLARISTHKPNRRKHWKGPRIRFRNTAYFHARIEVDFVLSSYVCFRRFREYVPAPG